MTEETRLDTSVAHAARVYDYLLGGKDNFQVDRTVAEAMITAIPGLPCMARANRAFLHRAARIMAEQLGIHQFLALGTGLPTSVNLHETVQAIEHSTRVVYVDNDPFVLAFARALLTSHPQGHCAYVDADLRDPRAILADPAVTGVLDLSRPVGVTLTSVLALVADEDDPWGKVAELRDAMPSGSCLAITHPSADFDPEAVNQAVAVARSAAMTLVPRTREQVAGFFGDWALLAPGLVPAAAWRPDPSAAGHAGAACWAGVACKP